MRTATLALTVCGVGLLLGTALVASFKIPCRVEELTTTASIGGPIYRVYSNVWGQPLRAVSRPFVLVDANQKAVGSATEEGPYLDRVRQGKWRRVIQSYEPGSTLSIVISAVWYLDDREVSAAEWEQRQ